MGDYEEDNPWMTIVGVAEDVIDRGDFEETWYLPYTQRRFTREIVTLVAQSETEPGNLIAPIRSAIHEIDETQPVFEVATHAEMLADSHREQRFSTLLFEIAPTDPTTFLLIAVSTVLVALAASLIPAYRAARVDPMEVLRYQ